MLSETLLWWSVEMVMYAAKNVPAAIATLIVCGASIDQAMANAKGQMKDPERWLINGARLYNKGPSMHEEKR